MGGGGGWGVVGITLMVEGSLIWRICVYLV